MPELPEVEVTRLGIAPDLVGRRLASADFRCPALRYPLPHQERSRMLGQTLHNVRRRGKYLIFGFDTGSLLVHLGMSGSLRLLPPLTPVQKHDHVDMAFDCRHADRGGDGGTVVLRMRDPRRFGAMLWIEGGEVALHAHPLLAVLGLEPLSDEFSARWLRGALARISAPIKPALMDSHRVVGIGNIYASESLFRAGIDPRRPAGKVSLKRLERLVPEIQATLHRAIETGGSSLRDFIHSDGSSGYFQQEHFVYGRTGQPCRTCGTLIREIRQGNRATYFCPRCQT